jgi:hypothetical protein
MRSRFLPVLAFLPLLAGGCGGQVAEMPTWVGFDEYNDDAVLVLKVEPSASVLLAVGNVDQNGWRAKGPMSRIWLVPRDGYVVARVAATQEDWAYAVIQVRPGKLPGARDGAAPAYEAGFWSVTPADAAPEKGEGGPAYGPAGQARIPVLKATAARVSFAGTLRIEAAREPGSDGPPQKVGVTPATSPDDMEAVTRFMAQHYPKIIARIVPRPLEMMRRSGASD